MAQKFLTDVEVAQRYGVTRTTVWRWHRENPEFPRVVKLGKATARWNIVDLDAWDTSLASDVAA